MKKVLIGLIAGAAMTSCVKRQEVTPVENGTQIGTATINGTFWAKTDYVTDTLANGNDDENAGWSGMEGLTVIATVNENDLDNDFTSNSTTRTYTTTTDADGNYTLTVDAAPQGTDVEIYVDGKLDIAVLTDDLNRVDTDTNGVAIPETQTFEFVVDWNDNITGCKRSIKNFS